MPRTALPTGSPTASLGRPGRGPDDRSHRHRDHVGDNDQRRSGPLHGDDSHRLVSARREPSASRAPMPGGSVTRLTGRRCARCRFLRLTRSPVPVLMPRGAAGVRDPKPRQPLPELRSLGLGYFVVTERTAALLKAPFVRSNAWPTPAGRSSSVAAAPPARTANHAAHGRSGDTPTSCARSTPEAPSHGPVGGSGPHFDSILSPPCRRAVTALAHRVSEDVPLLRGNGPPPTIGGPFLCARGRPNAPP
jgi:hypothetical protein